MKINLMRSSKSLNNSKRIVITIYRLQEEGEHIKEKIQYHIEQKLKDNQALINNKLAEIRKDLVESKEYIQQLHNEIDKMERNRKKDKTDVIS
jgi:gas vesicle protein